VPIVALGLPRCGELRDRAAAAGAVRWISKTSFQARDLVDAVATLLDPPAERAPRRMG
jgi:hypothetical protein